MIKKISELVVALVFILLSFFVPTAMAQSDPSGIPADSTQLSRPTASPGAIPTVGTLDKTKLPVLSLNDLIKNGVYIAIALTGVIFFFMLIFGGIKYLTSGGDEKAAASARGTLTGAFIGLIIVVAAFLIAQLLFTLFGLQGISVTK